jgi:hypothetical protein
MISWWFKINRLNAICKGIDRRSPENHSQSVLEAAPPANDVIDRINEVERSAEVCV